MRGEIVLLEKPFDNLVTEFFKILEIVFFHLYISVSMFQLTIKKRSLMEHGKFSRRIVRTRIINLLQILNIVKILKNK